MGCTPSNLSINEPQLKPQRKIARNQHQLTDIQQNIEKHLKQQLGHHKRTTTSSPNTIITSTRSSRIADQIVDMSKSTTLFQIDSVSQPLQRRSLQ
ncbi:unnamed protein product [Paramecium octaurelia]|uniref:Uncharacterized protein n=1 Tax=Paramecium octaurelia TaxID=43137 RepID=A0A8S1YLN1_PAROT|nr:unnamed protein product [Paramecium octaurelia]